MWNYRAWRRKRLLKSAMLPVREWQQVLEALPVLHGLDASQTERLGQLTWLFLYEKAIHGVQGMEVTDAMRLRIAAQACLMILELDLDCYSGFQTVLVYPAGFRVRHEYEDEAGVVHTQVAELSGEAWERGPVILSADDVMAESNNDGVNLVIHEFAHKLDMLSGVANGLPPLHPGMDPNAWAQAFQNAYRDLCGRVDAGEALPIDEYATENPAECFAVFCEAFFEIPQILALAYPAVYRQLTLFYRQDPLRRQ
ncbi:MAG: zinc-dependent peptidase [Oceanospirillaceae bacterium]|nr:zinc-dependent peptidase [Oceanospirillaceae bacterium]